MANKNYFLIGTAVFLIIILAVLIILYTNRVNITCTVFRDYPTGESNCYFDYALKYKEVKYCEKVLDEEGKANCLEYLALSLRDRGICNLIDPNIKFYDENHRNLCFLQLAYIEGNMGLCSNIKNDEFGEGYCRLLTAIRNNDSTSCDDNYVHYFLYVDKTYGEKTHDYNDQGDDYGPKFNRLEFFEEGKRICIDIVNAGKFYSDRFSSFQALRNLCSEETLSYPYNVLCPGF